MAANDVSDFTDGPVMTLVNKRLRALKKKYNRIVQMEESIAQGKTLNKEQEEVLRSKPAVIVLIDELEKLRAPLSSAVSEEISLAVQRHPVSSGQTAVPGVTEQKDDSPPDSSDDCCKVEDLVNLLYFGSLFDVKTQNDFASIVLTRTHERGCCLTYDYVTDDATDLLGERDLDLISMLRGLMISRPVDSSLSHKNALQRCIEHAKLWLANSDQPIDPDAAVSYSGLREKLKKIMASDYFTTTPEMKAPVEVAAAAGNYASFQAPIVAAGAPIQVEDSTGYYQPKEEDASTFQEPEAVDNQAGPAEEHHNDKQDTQELEEVVHDQQEQLHQQAEPEHDHRDFEHREQHYVPRRSYQRSGRGGGGGSGRRGYSNGRGGRGSGGGRSGGGYQNGRNQYYDQVGGGGEHYQRSYYNNRGRGGRRGGGGHYNNHGAYQGGRGASDFAVAS